MRISLFRFNDCLKKLVFSQGTSTDTFFVHFTVPAFQFLGAMPLAVIKGSMSRLVEPQEQGKFITGV